MGATLVVARYFSLIIMIKMLFSVFFYTIITMHFASTSYLSTSGLMGNITNDSSYFYTELLTKWGGGGGGGGL